MSNYDHAIKLHIHNSEIANSTVNTFLLAETVILGFLANGFFECQASEHSWWLFGGSVFGLLLVFPWWASYSYRLYFHKLRVEQAKRYEDKEYEHKDTEAVIGQLLSEGDKLKKGGSICINGKPICIEGLAKIMRIRTAYRFLMLMFALAFLFMTIASLIPLI